MQEDNTNNAASGSTVEESVPQTEEKLVSSKVVEDYRRDMHKYKTQSKELKSKLAEIEAKLKADEEAKMVEKQQWEELYKQAELEKQTLQQQARDNMQKYVNTTKLSALKGELGGNVSDVYLNKLANLDSIVVNEDGSIDSESLAQAANEFRSEHGQLIPKSTNGNITNPASPSNLNPSSPKDISSMSSNEVLKAYLELKAKQ